MTIPLYSLGALLAGVLLDLLLGDPQHFPHIVRWAGGLIARLDMRLPHTVGGGACLLLLVSVLCTGLPFVLLLLCYRYLPPLGFLLESLLCYQLLAARSLRTESMLVYHSLQKGDVAGARGQVSRIVGRETAALDQAGITRAAVETVAENTSDALVAPLFYIMLGGAAAGCLYKAVNTMDSMVGYKNREYLHFGRCAARADDLLNYLPARLSALLMIAAAFLLRLDGKAALRIWKRDRRRHESPNAAQTESVCAGALGVQLAGPAVYQGRLQEKPTIGDALRPIENADILRANRLMMVTAALALLLVILVRMGGIALALR